MAPAILAGAKNVFEKVVTNETGRAIIRAQKTKGKEMEETKMNKRYTLDWLTKKDLENLMRGLQLLTELNNAKGKDSRENELLLPLIDKIVESAKEG